MTKEIYVTNTETIYEENGAVIRLYGRDDEGDTDPITVEGFEPYFYVLEEATNDIRPRDHDNFVRYEETDFVHLKGNRPLKKVVVDDPRGMNSVKDLFGVENTGEADVDFTNRLRIDKGIETGVRAPSSRCHVDELEAIEMEGEPRVVTFDIETDDRGAGFPDPGEARILSVVAHDSYTDETIGFVDLNGMGIEDALPECASSGEAPEELDSLEFSPNERRMLIRFASWVDDTNPDIISGWNSNWFDLPHLIERMDEVGANSNRLARDGDAYINWKGEGVIHGRTPYDMMDAWEDTKFQGVRSSTLDHASQLELNDAKIEHQDVGFYDLYDTNLRKFLNYNAKDVRLTVEIDKATSALAFKTKLRHIIGLDYEQTQNNNQFVEMMIRRKLYAEGLVGPTADPPDEKVDFEGAYVFDSFYGVLQNIVGIDLASLYPMTLWMLNASYETKVEPMKTEQREDGLYALIEVGDGSDGYKETEWVPVSRAPNDVYFRLDVDSIMREVTDDALDLKATYKERRKAAEYGTEEHEEMAETYSVAKTIVNSEYGVLGWEQFFLFDKEVAEAVTLMGQEVIKATAEYVTEESVAEVAYGDTDSNYIKFPDEMEQEECLEEAQEMCDHLNEEVYPPLAESFGMSAEDNRWLIELEMFASRFLQTGSKKQYAYLKEWDEGMDFGETIEGGSFSVTGYHCVKSNFSALTKETQKAVLEAIVRDEPESVITDIVFNAVNRIDADDPDWSLIGIPGGLGKELRDYNWTNGSPQGAQPRAAYFGNELLDVNFGEGDSPMRAYVHPTTLSDDDGETHEVDVIGYEYENDLDPIQDDLKLDVQATQQKTVENPLEDILDVVDIDVDAAVKNQTQTGLASFC